jgi:hypothetical protein
MAAMEVRGFELVTGRNGRIGRTLAYPGPSNAVTKIIRNFFFFPYPGQALAPHGMPPMPTEKQNSRYLCYYVTTLGPILPDQTDLPDQSGGRPGVKVEASTCS